MDIQLLTAVFLSRHKSQALLTYALFLFAGASDSSAEEIGSLLGLEAGNNFLNWRCIKDVQYVTGTKRHDEGVVQIPVDRTF